MVQAVSYGLFLGITMLAGYLWRNRWSRLGQMLWLAVIGIELAALACTYTRSVWIGTALAILITLALTLRGIWRPIVLGGLVSSALVISVIQLDSLANLQREGSATEAGTSADMRACFAYVSWQMFLDRPILGFGFGQFYREKQTYLSDHSTPLQLELIRDFIHHNTYLSLLTETGIVGLGLYLAILIGWARRGWRLTRGDNPAWVRAHGILFLGALATYAVQMLFHEVSYTTLDNSLLFFLAGIAVGLEARCKQPAVAQTENERELAAAYTV
jgi:O-antigen ligase